MEPGVWPRGAAGDSGERKRRLSTAFAGAWATETQWRYALGMRLLAVVRLSDLTDETTSPERQRNKIDTYAGCMSTRWSGWPRISTCPVLSAPSTGRSSARG